MLPNLVSLCQWNQNMGKIMVLINTKVFKQIRQSCQIFFKHFKPRHWNLPRSRKYGRVHGIGPFSMKLTEMGKKTEKSRKIAILGQYFPFFIQKIHFLARTGRISMSVGPRAWNLMWYFHTLCCYHATKCENKTENSKHWGPTLIAVIKYLPWPV